MFLLTIIPAGLALLALLLSLRYIGQICNWKRDYQEEKEQFESSEEEEDSSNLIKKSTESNSLVEKEITIDSSNAQSGSGSGSGS